MIALRKVDYFILHKKKIHNKKIHEKNIVDFNSSENKNTVKTKFLQAKKW